MQLIDTHTHLYRPEFDPDRDEIVRTAVATGVEKLLLPNIDLTSFNPMLDAVKKYPGICYPMIGLHPTSVREDFLSQLDELEKIAEKHKFLAIGEIGIDLYWDKTFINEQLEAFSRQIEYAIEKNLPVAIHSRESFPVVFPILEKYKGRKLKGVLHAFTGDTADAAKAVELGFKLGIGGIVTFKNSGLDKVVQKTGIEHLILETDSPYLAPAPHRGKRNESSYLCLINRKISEIFGITEEKSAAITYATSTGLFSI